LDVALLELAREQLGRLGGFGAGVLESACRKALGDRYPEDAKRDREQRRRDDDSTRCGDGQPSSAIQQFDPPLERTVAGAALLPLPIHTSQAVGGFTRRWDLR
jgi:hypothetical protein